jgi:hypothetical protein
VGKWLGTWVGAVAVLVVSASAHAAAFGRQPADRSTRSRETAKCATDVGTCARAAIQEARQGGGTISTSPGTYVLSIRTTMRCAGVQAISTCTVS